MKQVEYQEKAAVQAKEEVSTSGLDILMEIVGYIRSSFPLYMRKDSDKRMTSALEEKKLADAEKRVKEEAANNSKLQQFLVDRAYVIDMLDGNISEKCQDVNLLKVSLKQAVSSFLGKSSSVSPFGVVDSVDEHVQAATKNPIQSLNSVTSVVSPKHELLMKMLNMDLEAQEIDKNLTLGSNLENSHVVSNITQVGHTKSIEGYVALSETHNQEVALPSAIKSCNNKKSKKWMIYKKKPLSTVVGTTAIFPEEKEHLPPMRVLGLMAMISSGQCPER
ncbi:hypothetical protein Tco_0343550 [Tanacetum coccineum]